MGLDLAATSFEPWVDHFVTASNTLSGISRRPTPGEVAAHRGFFARRRVGAPNLLVLNLHLGHADDAIPDRDACAPDRLAEIAALLSADLTPWQLYVAFGDLSPFPRANRRCARALWMSRRLEQGDRPEADRSPRDWVLDLSAQRRSAAPPDRAGSGLRERSFAPR